MCLYVSSQDYQGFSHEGVHEADRPTLEAASSTLQPTGRRRTDLVHF